MSTQYDCKIVSLSSALSLFLDLEMGRGLDWRWMIMGGLFTPLIKTPSNLGYFSTEVRKPLFGPQPLRSLPLA